MRLTIGAILGVIAGFIATHWTTDLYSALIGLGVAVLIWFGIEILDELA